jgi:hypothetical protein
MLYSDDGNGGAITLAEDDIPSTTFEKNVTKSSGEGKTFRFRIDVKNPNGQFQGNEVEVSKIVYFMH